MQLLEDRVLIKPYPKEDVSTGGIIIPDTAKGRPEKGKVIKVGNGYTIKDGPLAGQKIPMTVKEGDDVLFGENVGQDITFENEKVLIMLQGDIIAVI